MRSYAFCLLILLALPGTTDVAATWPPRQLVGNCQSTPIRFEPNAGQFDPNVRFGVRAGPLHVASLDATGFTTGNARIVFRGATATPHVESIGRASGVTNYFLGADPSRWRTGIPAARRVAYRDLYPGVDALFYAAGSSLEYDLIVAPEADPSAIALGVEGVLDVAVEPTGDLVLTLPDRTIRHRRPLAYQERDGHRTLICARYQPRGADEFGFILGAYDPTSPLVIDPIVGLSTYTGGSQTDLILDMVVGPDGSLLVAGYGDSANLSTVHPIQATAGGRRDIYLGKLDASGVAFEFLTYLGGDDDDEVGAIGLDGAGNIYLAGSSDSRNFPLMNPLQPVNAGMSDLIVAKLDPTGSELLYSTYLGNFGGDFASDLKVDAEGNAYVIGGLTFPFLGGDAVVVKLNPQGSAIVYGVAIDVSGSDQGSAIAIDKAGNAFIAGRFRISGGGLHALLAKLNATGNGLVYAIGFGGSADDFANDMDVDAEGNAYVFGATRSTDFPTGMNIAIPGARPSGVVELKTVVTGQERLAAVRGSSGAIRRIRLEPTQLEFERTIAEPTGPPFGGGMFDTFVTKVNPEGNTLLFSRYLGGNANESAASVAVSPDGVPYVVGGTGSTNFPLVDPLQATSAGGDDAYLAKLDPTTGAVLFSTLYGGNGRDVFLGIAFPGDGAIWLGGSTQSTNFPTATPLQTTNAGGQDGVLVRLDDADFGLSTAAAQIAVRRGDAGTLPITIQRAPGFTGVVTVRAPATSSIKVKFKPASVSAEGTEARFTFKIKKKAVLGTHELVFSGQGPTGEPRTVTITLVVSQ